MALPRFEKLSAERRTKLIAAAAEEFATNGFQRAALSSIARRSDMGKASVYYYFADKADLYATVLDEAWRRLSTASRYDLESVRAEDFWSAFEATVRDNLALCQREPWLLAAAKLLNHASLAPSNDGVQDEYFARRRTWEEAFIRRGQALGAIRSDVPAELLAAVSLSTRQASNLWILDRMESLGPDEWNRLALQALGIYRALLEPRPASVTP